MSTQGDGVYRLTGTIAYTDTSTAVEIGTVPAYGMLLGIYAFDSFAGGSGDWFVSITYNITGDVGDGFVDVANFTGTASADYVQSDTPVAGATGGQFTPLSRYAAGPVAFSGLFVQGGTPTTSGSMKIVALYALFDTP